MCQLTSETLGTQTVVSTVCTTTTVRTLHMESVNGQRSALHCTSHHFAEICFFARFSRGTKLQLETTLKKFSEVHQLHHQPSTHFSLVRCLLFSCNCSREGRCFCDGLLRMAAHPRWQLKKLSANCHQGYCFVVFSTTADADDDAVDA